MIINWIQNKIILENSPQIKKKNKHFKIISDKSWKLYIIEQELHEQALTEICGISSKKEKCYMT